MMVWEKTVWILVTVVMIYMVMISLTMNGWGDDTEDKGKPTLNEQLLERAREWNIQKEINETLVIADRFSCDTDESLCVLGVPDPDFCTGNMTKMDREICDG